MYNINHLELKINIKKTNRDLFSGFSYISRLLKKDKLAKYKTHSRENTRPEFLWGEVMNESVYTKRKNEIHSKIKKRGYSNNFKMSNRKRKRLISDSFAKTFGFIDYKDYLKQRKLESYNNFKKIDELTLPELLALENTLIENLKSAFNLKDEHLILEGINKKKYIQAKHNKVINREYTSEDNIIDLIAYTWHYSLWNNGNDWDLSPENIENIKKKLHFHHYSDLYEQGNSFEYFDFKNKDNENITYDYSFLKKPYYLHELLNVKDDIQNLTEKEFILLKEKIDNHLVPFSFLIIELLRENKMDDPVIKYLIDVKNNFEKNN